MLNIKEKIEETTRFINTKINIKPEIGIVLGTGLGKLVNHIKNKIIIPYKEIPNFLISTAISHIGQLVIGKIGSKNVIAMEGRFHYYEGYDLKAITFPIQVMKFLGVEILIVSNAAGGLNPQFELGDLMIITDHINLMGHNPLIGQNDEELGPRFPDMYEAYNKQLINLTYKIALEQKIKIQKGVYAGVIGPNLETAAEYKFLRIIGADAVGMSTVSEVIVARHSNLKVLGISCITDLCSPDKLKPANVDEIIKIANESEPVMTRLIRKVIQEL